MILPDTASSLRWESFDRPLLEAAFEAAGIECDIQNAEGDKTKFATIADQMISRGRQGPHIVNLDSDSGAPVQKKAKAAGIKTIDYDRLTLGGGADVLRVVRQRQGRRAAGRRADQVPAAPARRRPRSSRSTVRPTDNNATLFKQGYDDALDPKSRGLEDGRRPAVPNWDNAQAATIFEQLLTAAGGKVDGVLVANDGMAAAVITVLKPNGLAQGAGHRSGRHASRGCRTSSPGTSA